MSLEERTSNAMYIALDQTLRERLTDEVNKKLDRYNEVENVLKTLKEEVASGQISDIELQEIVASTEFKYYTVVS